MREAAPLLVVEDLKTHFFTRRGVTKAVDGVSFSVRAGETLALVGESGSGKSVTCLSLVRLVPEPAGRIVGGRILLDGEDLLRKTPAEMRRGRGREIAMGLQWPTTSLDVTIQAQYLALLEEVRAASGVAVILVTHDFGIVANNADRVAVMYAGRIVETGATREVFDRPAHPYTRALLRCLPDVELKRRRLVEIGGQPPDLTSLPPGCPFAPRCPDRQPQCETAYPPAVSVGDGHVAHCWVAAPAAAPAARRCGRGSGS